MKMPVLITLPSQSALIASAEAMFLSAEAALPLSLGKIELPPGIELEPSVPAMPLGSGTLDSPLESFLPKNSKLFLLQAYIDVIDRVPEWIGEAQIFANPRMVRLETCEGDGPIGSTSDVASLLNVSDLESLGLDGKNVAIALVDDGVGSGYVTRNLPSAYLDLDNSWGNAGLKIVPGAKSSFHGDCSAFDATICAPRATLLDCPALLVPGTPGASLTEALLTGPSLVYTWLLHKWAVRKDALAGYNGLVISNGWGVPNQAWDFEPTHTGNYVGNPNHPFNLLVAQLANAGADIVFAAGNCGRDCPDAECDGVTDRYIMGASALQQVLTLGAVDIGNRSLSYSSQGPGIANMWHDKPDLAAYAHFLGSDVGSAGIPDVGTSASCAVAAGCVAALRTQWGSAQVPPADLFEKLRVNATRVAGNGWDPRFGLGIINPVATAKNLP
jgi:Subtilase family